MSEDKDLFKNQQFCQICGEQSDPKYCGLWQQKPGISLTACTVCGRIVDIGLRLIAAGIQKEWSYGQDRPGYPAGTWTHQTYQDHPVIEARLRYIKAIQIGQPTRLIVQASARNDAQICILHSDGTLDQEILQTPEHTVLIPARGLCGIIISAPGACQRTRIISPGTDPVIWNLGDWYDTENTVFFDLPPEEIMRKLIEK